MDMNIGRHIKALRMQKGVTQEALAGELRVTYQAVSKWETGVSLPDIALLPELAVYFGVTIDQLFSLPQTAKLTRIRNMLQNAREISPEEFQHSRVFLLDVIAEDADNADACNLLAWLYLKQAKDMRENAVEYAKAALIVDPGCKNNHAVVREAYNGYEGDYYMTRRYALIDLYQELTRKNPDNLLCNRFLFRLLMEDNRIDEAEVVLGQMRKLAPRSVYILFNEGDIAYRRGDLTGALEAWNRGIAEHDGDVWAGYFLRAGRMEMLCRYEEALSDYQKDLELAAKPRYIDSVMAMAQIYEHLGRYDHAIKMREVEITIQKDEWGIISGEAIDKPAREIERLKTLMSDR